MRKHVGPLTVAILMLLPMLYIGSYLALVVPAGFIVDVNSHLNGGYVAFVHYRLGAHRIESLYWPLEQIDRRVRPDVWK
ncbi:hypothetical protein NA78x_001326 [Anatilimnocola sp. NA78]|uniref:hypothetical protein n=1 Tax=Anatilimnocola sp. NA78 TaxID=3415683 RepID=UPI003CE49C8D